MTAILFIHGFPFDHLMWRHQLTAFPGLQCIAPDLRGAGANPGPESPDHYSMAAYATDLIRLLDESQVEKATICGLSMGGYIAFELLRRVPERVNAAVLCHTKAPADTPDAKHGRDTLAERARADGSRAVADELVPRLLSRPTQPTLVREVTEMIERQSVAGIVGALHALRERPDSTPLLWEIRVPVLVVAGDDDQIAPAAGMKEMARAIPDARFTLIGASGHLSPLEQPAAFNAALSAFL